MREIEAVVTKCNKFTCAGFLRIWRLSDQTVVHATAVFPIYVDVEVVLNNELIFFLWRPISFLVVTGTYSNVARGLAS